jgi:hypothetical protein
MLDTIVLTSSGTVIDFDYAAPLMDRELLRQTLAARRDERDNRPRWDAEYGAQWVWGEYCERHYEHYGEWFGPDVIPGWYGFPMPQGPLCPAPE